MSVRASILSAVIALAMAACGPPPLEMSVGSVSADFEDHTTEDLVLLGTILWSEGRLMMPLTLEMVTRTDDDALARTWMKGIACAQPEPVTLYPRNRYLSGWAGDSRTAFGNLYRRSTAPWTRDVLLCHLARWREMRSPDEQAAQFDGMAGRRLEQLGQRGQLVNVSMPFGDAFQAMWLARLCKEPWYSTTSSGGLHRRAVVWPYRHHPDPDVRAAAELCFTTGGR